MMSEIICATIHSPPNPHGLPVALDAQNFAMLATVDQYLTPEDWADAAAAGRVPGVLGPQSGRIFARAFGAEPAAGRWYSLTQAEAASDPWPCGLVPMSSRESGRLSLSGGQDCERALAWCMERDLRVPDAGWMPDAAATAQRAPWSVVRGPFVPMPAPTHTDLMVAPESIPDLDPEACEDAPAPSPQSERMRAMLHDRPPMMAAAPAEHTWHHPVALAGWGLLVLLAFTLLAGVCS